MWKPSSDTAVICRNSAADQGLGFPGRQCEKFCAENDGSS